MTAFVVAVGTVMAVLGLWAVYFGYTIVQVERGWATMIAGAVVLSGGVVTVALGLVLRRLQLMQDAFGPRAVHAPRLDAEVQAAPPALSPQLELALAPPGKSEPVAVIAPDAAPQVADMRPEPPFAHAEAPHAASLTDVPAVTLDVSPPTEHPGVDEAWQAVHAELQRTDWHAVAPEADALASPLPDDAALVVEEPAASAPSASAVPLPRPVEESAKAPAPVFAEPEFEDDYKDLLGRAPEAADSPAADMGAVPVRDELVEPTPHAGTPPVHAPDLHAPDAASEAQIIGKYDADGTLYTMFSDGSIEAHSAEGTYRFGSMAELKAFIEQAS